MQTDLSWCVADTACTKIYACPSFEEITIVRSAKPASPLDAIELTGIPLPLVSYGGTFLVSTLFTLGLVQSVYVRKAG